MNIIKKTQGIDLRAKNSALRGNVTIQLKDAVTGHVKNEISGHNMLTNGLNSALNGCPFQLNVVDSAYSSVVGTQRMNMTPIFSQLLGGVMLFPEPLGNDPDLLFPPFSNSPTAFASMEAYTQDDSRQGLFDAVSSKPIGNGYRFIYEWGSSYGNGFISSLGLSTRNCHTWIKKRANLFRPWTEVQNVQGGFASAILNWCRFMNISNRGTIVALGTSNYNGYNNFYYFKRYTPIVANLLENTAFNFDFTNPYDESHLNGYDWKITISDMNIGNSMFVNVQNVNDELLFVYRVNGTGAVKIKKVSWDDGSTISDTTMNPQGVSYGSNSIPAIVGDYMYIVANRDGLIYRCKLNDNADVFDIEAPGCLANTHLFDVGTNFLYNNNGILDATSAKFESCDAETVVMNNGMSVPIADLGMWQLRRVNAGSLGATLKTWGLMSHFDLGQTFEKNAQQTMSVQYTVTQV